MNRRAFVTGLGAVLAAAGDTHIRVVSHDDRGDMQMFATARHCVFGRRQKNLFIQRL